MNNQLLSEKDVREAVKTYFDGSKFNEFTVDTECHIHIGAGKHKMYGIADVVLKGKDGYWAAIVECKGEKDGDSEKARDQLKSYLCATDTRFGILAFNANPNEWIYCENLRSNVFRVRKKTEFEQQVSDPPTLDRKNQAIFEQEKLKYQKSKRRSNVVMSVLAILLFIAIVFSVYQLIPKDSHYQVIDFIDGDTVKIKYKGKTTSVQLIGVNAPETMRSKQRQEFYGEEATEYLREFLLDDLIYLRFDEDKWDEHERILGYVYRASDGVFVNLEMIREGYAEVDLRYAFKYEELFTDHESRAKNQRKGLWQNSY